MSTKTNAKTRSKGGAHDPKAMALELLRLAVDSDPVETREWVESFDSIVEHAGTDRAAFLLKRLIDRARALRALPPGRLISDYLNTVPVTEQPNYPGDREMERRIRRIIRWNAACLVHRANQRSPGLGGHLSTYASAASLYEVGFNHFFKGKDAPGGGDLIYYQGHAAPGIYARSFLEGSLTAEQLDGFRRETDAQGIPSYPHPRLLSDYWEFPTVSMGLGPIAAIYQARFNRYLAARGLKDTSQQRVWAFLGDGETDEPESLGSLSIAAREKLDNLTFVINCNLQRLDGPVRGNGKIIHELEAVFRGNGWNVVKVIWGSEWDPLFAKDEQGLLRHVMNELKDGHFQKFSTMSGAEIRQEFLDLDPRLAPIFAGLSDDQIRHLRRGGHDMRKLYAAYKTAVETKDQPTCILAHTVKGWTLGEGFEAKNVTHQMKKMELEELRKFRDRLNLPISDADLPDAPYYHPGEDSEEVRYMRERRESLGGLLPQRRSSVAVRPALPPSELYDEFKEGTPKGKEGVSTTIAFVRLLTKLIRDKELGKFVVPIIPDEARTFGMDPLFRMVGIYASKGQVYEPVDAGLLLYYREAPDGQVLEEGITEAGAMASFQAAGTAYATHGVPTIPFYIFYSMFGFQRTGDQIWAFGDARGRGFLLGATAGRTTLNGEGLQHADGHSQVLASTVPNVEAYDPAFAFEIAVIIEEGLRRMTVDDEDVFYYLTLQNENYPMAPMPKGSREGILEGLYLFRPAEQREGMHVQLLGSASILNEVLRAQELLEGFGVSADVWSVTSYGKLRKGALAAERWNRLHPKEEPKRSWLDEKLGMVAGPIIAASDFMKVLPDSISRFVPGPFLPLGTDGFGMSDTRAALRRHFEVDAENIALAALEGLVQDGALDRSRLGEAVQKLGIDPEKRDPTRV